MTIASNNFLFTFLANKSVYREPIRTRTTRGITVECLEECTRLGPRMCGAVVVQTRIDLEQRCFALSRSASPDGRELVEAGDTVYFQPMCMSGASVDNTELVL